MTHYVEKAATFVRKLSKNIVGQEAPPEAPASPMPQPDAGTGDAGAVTPTMEQADESVRAREAQDAKLRKKGRASYILTGDQGAGNPTTAAKTLTGE